MKLPLILVAAAGSLFAMARPAPAAEPAIPGHTIANSQLRVLPRNAHGRQYQLHVGLPGNYAAAPARRYPVVYVTDGYWDFEKLAAIRGTLVYDKVVPEFIIVGIGYPGEGVDYGAMRQWELSPVAMGADPAASGQAAKYLQSIETEIIPFIEREYRVDPGYRVLGGASLGGLFTLYAMYTKPELFQAYIAATPAVIVGNDWLLGYDEAIAKSGKPIHARVYVTGGGNESPGFLGGILRFNAQVSRRNYAGLTYEFRIIEGERHAGMQLESYTRGLRFAFAPRAPESGPASSP
ncbi:MAG: alpha/beta hydrolase [Opitutaceae bacterium]|nr:alpha/beta hydrolase [Opitutaceae bacterium]